MFSLSLRHVELLLAERGVVVSYEMVQRWCKKFGARFADRLRRRRPRPGDKWRMDEVFIRIRGAQHISGVPPIRMALCSTSSFRPGGDANAAKRFFKQLLSWTSYIPGKNVIISMGWLRLL